MGVVQEYHGEVSRSKMEDSRIPFAEKAGDTPHRIGKFKRALVMKSATHQEGPADRS